VCIWLKFSNKVLQTLTTLTETHSLFSDYKANITYVISLWTRLAQTTHNTFRTLSDTQQSRMCLRVAKSTEDHCDITTVKHCFDSAKFESKINITTLRLTEQTPWNRMVNWRHSSRHSCIRKCMGMRYHLRALYMGTRKPVVIVVANGAFKHHSGPCTNSDGNQDAIHRSSSQKPDH